VDRAFAPDGAVTYFREAQRRGLVRFIGVARHATPAAHRRALEHWDRGLVFDVMQLPLNPVDFRQPSFQRQVLPGLVARGIGVIAIKTLADAALVQDGPCTIEECPGYVWSLPVSVAVVGMDRPELVYRDAALARRHAPLAADRMERIRARAASRAGFAVEWYRSPTPPPTG
jgi:predicted aldo/keto reductase-like oxidoreductase